MFVFKTQFSLISLLNTCTLFRKTQESKCNCFELISINW